MRAGGTLQWRVPEDRCSVGVLRGSGSRAGGGHPFSRHHLHTLTIDSMPPCPHREDEGLRSFTVQKRFGRRRAVFTQGGDMWGLGSPFRRHYSLGFAQQFWWIYPAPTSTQCGRLPTGVCYPGLLLFGLSILGQKVKGEARVQVLRWRLRYQASD